MERRKAPRVPITFPVFVRRVVRGKSSLEFGTVLDISVGGLLLALRRPLEPKEKVTLEIPLSPVAILPSQRTRKMAARALRTTPSSDHYLLAMKFTRPLSRAYDAADAQANSQCANTFTPGAKQVKVAKAAKATA